MKTIKNLGFTGAFIITVLSLAAFIGKDMVATKKSVAKVEGKGFAVLELFTSEGCSSCPPADELLAKLEKESQGKDVYILAYHVDYWNRLGWKDSFSSADYSKRQAQYSHWLNAEVYTPQLVINGKVEFVGSDEAAIRRAISNQLTTKPGVSLAIQAHQDGAGLHVQYQAGNAANGSRLLLAVIQKNAQSKVERGENAGHTLSHVQIVRSLQTEALNTSGTGSATLALPKGFNSQSWEVLALVQDQSSGQITGAAKADLNTGAGK